MNLFISSMTWKVIVYSITIVIPMCIVAYAFAKAIVMEISESRLTRRIKKFLRRARARARKKRENRL